MANDFSARQPRRKYCQFCKENTEFIDYKDVYKRQEIRKLLPKGAGIRFDRLSPADLALAMSHVNSEPRGALGLSLIHI